MKNLYFFKFLQRIVFFVAVFVAAAASVNAQALNISGNITLVNGTNFGIYSSLNLTNNVTFNLPTGATAYINIPITSNNDSYTVTVQLVSSGTGSSGTIYFNANNTYKGTTTIGGRVSLYIGDNTSTGAIAGNIENDGLLFFSRSNNYTYDGVISGQVVYLFL